MVAPPPPRHDWGLIIGIIALVAAFPLSLLANIATPLLLNWFSKWSKNSLDNRIIKLEKALAALEVNPEIDEVQDRILWEISRTRIFILAAFSNTALVILYAVNVLADPKNPRLNGFVTLVMAMCLLTVFEMLRERYLKDFRYKRSPKVRRNLRASIQELKTLQANWGQRVAR